MQFLLDENIPVSVCRMLRENGHDAHFVRDYIPTGSPDQLVATICERLNGILVSFDGDFERIAPRIPQGARRRFRRLCRIRMMCSEYQAAQRLMLALSLVQSEYELAAVSADVRMLIWISHAYIKIHR